MAINLNDQQVVSLGGSNISPRDTFSMPGIDQGAERNAQALAKSLEGFGGALSGYSEAETKRRNQEASLQRQLHATQIADAIGKGEAIDVATGRIAPNLSNLNRIAAQQAAGNLVGNTLADQALLNVPEGLADRPDELAGWYQSQRMALAEKYKDNPFFTAGVLESINTRFTAHQANLYAKANAEGHKNQLGAFSSGVDNIITSTVPPKPSADAIRTGAVPPPSPTYGYGVNTGAAPNKSAAQALVSHSNSLGLNPYDIATLISYETGGTFNPGVRGGKNNAHVGLIQFGAEEQRKYGIKPGMTFEQQMVAVAGYLKDRGARPGDDLLTLYKIVNGGNRNVSSKASDGNGTIEQHVARMRAEHAGNAARFLTGNADPRLITASGRPVDAQTGAIQPAGDQDSIFDDDEPDHILDSDKLALRTALLSHDQEADQAAAPQTTRRERKKAMFDSLVRKALETRDVGFLYVLPETMLDPEEKDKVRELRDQIGQLKMRDYEYKRRLKKDQEEDEFDANLDSVLADLADPAKAMSIDPLTDPRIVVGGKRSIRIIQAITAAQNLPRVPDYVSSGRVNDVTAAYEAYVQTGDVSGLKRIYGIKGGNIESKLREAVALDPKINAVHKDAFVKGMPNVATSAAAITDQVVKDAYTAGDLVRSTMSTPYAKLVPPTLGADIDNYFKKSFNNRVRAWHSENPGKTLNTGEKARLAREANDEARAEFDRRWAIIRSGNPDSGGGTGVGFNAEGLKRTVKPDGTVVYQ